MTTQLSEQQQQQILTILNDGYSVAEAARKVNIAYSTAYVFARKNGWTLSERTQKTPRKSVAKKRWLSIDQILALDAEGYRQTEIADIAGVSRQAIQQLLVKHGATPAREKLRQRREANRPYVNLIRVLNDYRKEKQKIQTREQRYQRLVQRWAKARAMWDRGVPAEEIRQHMKIKPGSFNWLVGRYRKEFGWFPKRKPFNSAVDPLPTQRIIERHKAAVELWEQGVHSFREICEHLGKNYSLYRQTLSRLRRKYGLFQKGS